MDRLNLLPKDTFTLVFNPYSLLQSNGLSDITFEAVVINNCGKLDMRRYHLDLLLNYWYRITNEDCISDYGVDRCSHLQLIFCSSLKGS